MLSALWGVLYEGLTSDVTAVVREHVRDDALSVNATARLLGDPAQGRVKQLRVVYQKGGAVAKKIVKEGEILTVGYEKASSPRLIVTKAVYGHFPSGRTVDVTLRLSDMVENDRLSLNDYNALVEDPAYGQSKELRVEYSVDGRAQSKTVAERAPLDLSVPKRR